GHGYGFDVLNQSTYQDFELVVVTAHPNFALKTISRKRRLGFSFSSNFTPPSTVNAWEMAELGIPIFNNIWVKS
ncbi:MAG: hypothetical protein AAFR87_32365, partial [Bacteroidota bacterium]